MLESLSLQNFQSHKNSELEFDPGVNVIVGPSDSGKTAVIRALRWLVWGRPLGDAFIHHSESLCRVRLAIDGEVVTREKTKKGETSYQFLDHGYTALKGEVPDKIKDFLNIGEINLQQQLDRPFLLDTSPGKVAQHFNKIARLDLIDIATKNVLSWIKKTKSSVAGLEAKIEEHEEELEQYTGIDEADAKLDVLEEALGRLTSKQNTIIQIKQTCDRIEEIENEMDKYCYTEEMEERVLLLASSFDEANKMWKEGEELSGLVERIETIDLQISERSNVEAMSDRAKLVSSLMQDRAKIQDDASALYLLLENIQNTDAEFDNKLGEVSLEEKEFKENFPSVCPLCGQKVKSK